MPDHPHTIDPCYEGTGENLIERSSPGRCAASAATALSAWSRGELAAIGARPAQHLHDQIADQIADGHAAERSFEGDLRDRVLCER